MVKLRFYYQDEDGVESELQRTLEYDSEYEKEQDMLVDEFKSFLLAVGFDISSVSQVQRLEEDEWKYVLTKYHEWNEYYEKVYNTRKKINEI